MGFAFHGNVVCCKTWYCCVFCFKDVVYFQRGFTFLGKFNQIFFCFLMETFNLSQFPTVKLSWILDINIKIQLKSRICLDNFLVMRNLAFPFPVDRMRLVSLETWMVRRMRLHPSIQATSSLRSMYSGTVLHQIQHTWQLQTVLTSGDNLFLKSFRASTSSCRVFADYFKAPHTDKFVFSQESRNQKLIKNISNFITLKIVLFWIQSWKEHILLSDLNKHSTATGISFIWVAIEQELSLPSRSN